MHLPVHPQLRIARLAACAIALALQAVAWQPSRIPKTSIEVEIIHNGEEALFRLHGQDLPGDKLDGVLKPLGDTAEQVELRIVLPQEGEGAPTKALLELLARAQTAGLQEVSFWWRAADAKYETEGPFHPTATGVGPQRLNLAFPSPYRLEDLTDDARRSIAQQLRPRVRAEMKPTLLTEVVLEHLWGIVLVAAVVGMLLGGITVRMLPRRDTGERIGPANAAPRRASRNGAHGS